MNLFKNDPDSTSSMRVMAFAACMVALVIACFSVVMWAVDGRSISEITPLVSFILGLALGGKATQSFAELKAEKKECENVEENKNNI